MKDLYDLIQNQECGEDIFAEVNEDFIKGYQQAKKDIIRSLGSLDIITTNETLLDIIRQQCDIIETLHLEEQKKNKRK